MGFPTLVLGDLDLTDWAGIQYNTSVIAEGTSRGAPVPIEVAVKSWLQDGSVVVTQGYDNREVTLRVRLRGPDLLMLAEAEAALFAELGRPNLLTWTPADGFGPASVFVVVTSSMDLSPAPGEDIAESGSYPFRTYNLRLLCKAFVRSATETVTEALAATGTTTEPVNNGSSATNWTAQVGGVTATPSVVSGAVKVSSSSVSGTVICSLIYTPASTIDTSSTKYLVVDWSPESSAGTPTLKALGDGLNLPRVAQVGLVGGLIRTWFYAAAASVAVLDLNSSSTPPGPLAPAAVRSLAVDNVDRTDVKPAIGTNRQLQRRIEVGGSAPTPGSLAIEHETSALGDVLAYVWPSGPMEDDYCPAGRQHRTAGPSPTPDAAMVSGSREALDTATPTEFTIPSSALPAGLYTVMARLRFTLGVGDRSLVVTAATSIDGTQVGDARSLPARTFSETGSWVNETLGRFLLPVVDVPTASAAKTVITFTTTGGSTLDLDEVWLFNSTIGALIRVSCGTGPPAAGGASNRVFTDSPTLDRPRHVVLVGSAADGSDAHYPVEGFDSWQFPEFEPDSTNIFTVTSNALDASVSFRNFNQWHTHAAD